VTAQRDDDLEGDFTPLDPPHRALAVVADCAPLPAAPLTTEQMERLAAMHARAQATASRGRSKATRRAYDHDFADFAEFCKREANVDALDANAALVALYVDDLAARGYSLSTLGRRLAAISGAMREAGVEKRDLPTRTAAVDAVLGGIKRDHADAGKKQQKKAANVLSDLVALTRPLGTSTADIRDKALLTFGFWTAMRRSEIVALDVADVTTDADGMHVFLRRSKTDQLAAGRTIDVSRRASSLECPVVALRAWIDHAEIHNGPLFRAVDQVGRIGTKRLEGRTVANVVKRHVDRAGLDPRRFGAHSLRSGFVTTCDIFDISNSKIKRITGHKSDTVLDGYKRPRADWATNATRLIPSAS
jgi:integrase